MKRALLAALLALALVRLGRSGDRFGPGLSAAVGR